MIPEMRPYSGGPTSNQEMIVVTQTDTVALPRDDGGATGSEYGNSRLMNFLSDDVAPQERDLDTLMRGDPNTLSEPLTESPPPDLAQAADAPPPPPAEPIALPPLETLLNDQLQRQQEEDLYRGSSMGSYAQDMYTATRDVLSRIAA